MVGKRVKCPRAGGLLPRSGGRTKGVTTRAAILEAPSQRLAGYNARYGHQTRA
jgi:hypothetical protein